MKRVMEKALIKKFIIVLITIVMISNFIMPNKVQATELVKKGANTLTRSIFYLLTKVGDIGISLMQRLMIGDGTIENKDTESYEIKYSPGLIFSNEVALLDVNFINPSDKTHQRKLNGDNYGAAKWTERDPKTTETKMLDLQQVTTEFSALYDVFERNVKQFAQADTLEEYKRVINDYFLYVEYRDVPQLQYPVSDLVTNITECEQFDQDIKDVLGDTAYDVFENTVNSNGVEEGVSHVLAEYIIAHDVDSFYNKLRDLGIDYGTTASSDQPTSDQQREEYANALEIVIDENNIFGGKITDLGGQIEAFKQAKGYYNSDNIYSDKRSTGTWDYYRWIDSAGYAHLIRIYADDTVNMHYIIVFADADLDFYIGGPISSAAARLKKYVSGWYNLLRTIALVGLLSVLLYVAIRIILSSASANDRAKYKTMLKDWIVAMCIVFVLHYFMAFMLGMTSQVTEMIKTNVTELNNVNETTSDRLMSTVRTNIGFGFFDAIDTATDLSFGYTVMYLALVILTGVFTVQYLKRVVYMMFLTIIAPLIGLTYPLDKIKDGKAQAFSYWLREFIFNCLIQPVHLMLYALLVAAAIDFATENVIYAIVAIGFLVPAEKFIKEMFGLKSSGPTNVLGAAAGGAVVMSMLNKLRARPPKDDKSGGSGGGSHKGVRTPTMNAAASTSGGGIPGGGQGGGIPGGGGQGGGIPGGGGQGGGIPGGGGQGGGIPGGGGQGGGTGTAQTGNRTRTPYSIKNGLREVRRNIIGVNKIGSAAKWLGRTSLGVAAGLATGTAAIAANMADGDLFNDPRKAFTEIGATAGVGLAAGRGFGRNIGRGVSNTFDTFSRGAYGTEMYNNKKFDKEFLKSDGFKQIKEDAAIKQICEQNGIDVKDAAKTFLNNGIVEPEKIQEALRANIFGNEYKEYNDAGVTNPKEMAAIKRKYGSASYYKRLKQIKATANKKLENKQDFVNFVNNLRVNGVTIRELNDRNSPHYNPNLGLNPSKMYDDIIDVDSLL